jgi:hypothetical protein
MRCRSLFILAAVSGLSSAFALAESATAPASVDASTAAAMAANSGLNEMRGKLESKSGDPKTIRLTVDVGYNVEFSYDSKTAMINGGTPVTIDDLNYGDELIIRYSGKELKAVVVDRVNKALRPQ